MPPALPPVTVLACYVTPDILSRQASGIRIVYVNAGNAALHRVTFEIGYRTIDADISRTVEDAGTFAPGATIDHHFDAFVGVSYNGGITRSCTVAEAS